MKVSAKDPDENNIDALLFAYVEGTLTEEERRQLEGRIALDPALQTELEYWKESFVVEQDYNDTRLLEESLLQKNVKPVNSSASSFVFIITLVASVLGFLPSSVKEVPSEAAIQVEVPEINPGETKKNMPVPTQLHMPGKTDTISVSPDKNTTKSLTQFTVLPEKMMIEKVPAPVSLRIETEKEIPTIVIKEAKTKKLIARKTSGIRTITRKERRKIKQLKEKALQQRKANEFLKGRVPYVVPLNTSNF